MDPLRMLIADDDAVFADTLQMLLHGSAWKVRVAPNGLAALEALEQEAVDVLVTDLAMPLLDGLGLVAELKTQRRRCPSS